MAAPPEDDEKAAGRGAGGFWGSVSSLFKKGGGRGGAVADGQHGGAATLDELEDYGHHRHHDSGRTAAVPTNEELVSIAQSAHLDRILMSAKDPQMTAQVLRTLLDFVDPYSSVHPGGNNVGKGDDADDPMFEHNAAFALELATRSLLLPNRQRARELYPMFLSKFESVLTSKILGESLSKGWLPPQKKDEKLRHPYLMERVVVAILRSCIHLYDVPEMQPYLKTSLLLLFDMPPVFSRHVSSRLGCGMAIILRNSYLLFEGLDEWNMIGDLMEAAAAYRDGRGFVFDGIASCVDHAVPKAASPVEGEGDASASDDDRTDTNPDEAQLLSHEGGSVFVRLLTKFVVGNFEGDVSMRVPAMVRLTQVYWYLCRISNEGSARTRGEGMQPVPDKEMWSTVSSACYSVCLSDNHDVALRGVECLQTFLQATDRGSITDKGWVDILEAMTSDHPLASFSEARIKMCELLCKLLLRLIPELSPRNDNWDPLTDIIKKLALIVSQNLRAGRQGSVSPLFESTVETVTNMANVMSMPEFDKSGFSHWAGETLFAELEKVGAGGGSSKMKAATTRQEDLPSSGSSSSSLISDK
uniref:Uncharacterized protein n=1 Tax=Odontella aurita TaxID=265563 RepID=A0A7S4J7P6_9STRA